MTQAWSDKGSDVSGAQVYNLKLSPSKGILDMMYVSPFRVFNCSIHDTQRYSNRRYNQNPYTIPFKTPVFTKSTYCVRYLVYNMIVPKVVKCLQHVCLTKPSQEPLPLPARYPTTTFLQADSQITLKICFFIQRWPRNQSISAAIARLSMSSLISLTCVILG